MNCKVVSQIVAGVVDPGRHGLYHAARRRNHRSLVQSCRDQRARLQHRLRAFTLVELLIAVAITVLIVVLLGTMFSSLTSTTSRANQRIDAFRDARAALQIMERDFSGLVKGQWDTTVNPATPITRPAAYFAIETNRYPDPAAGNQQIFGLIAAKNSGRGDVCAVGYYCRWDEQNYGYSLRRYFRASDATFTALTSAPDYVGTVNLYTPDPPGTARGDLKDDLLAQYVWDLKIAAYNDAGAPIAITPPFVCDPSAALPANLPAVIEISFRVMSAEAARTVIAAHAGATVWMNEADTTYQRLIGPHAYQFRTRIKL